MCFLTARAANNGHRTQLVWNQSALLNNTKITSLRNTTANGFGQLHLSYVNTVDQHEAATGSLFSVLHDASATRSFTWNQNALTKPLVLASTSQIATSTLTLDASQWDPHHGRPPFSRMEIAPSTPSLPTSTSISSVGDDRSTSSNAVIASVVLGSMIMMVFLTFFTVLLIRQRRKRSRSAQSVSKEEDAQPRAPITTSILEKDAVTKSTEVLRGDERPEIAGERHVELPADWGLELSGERRPDSPADVRGNSPTQDPQRCWILLDQLLQSPTILGPMR